MGKKASEILDKYKKLRKIGDPKLISAKFIHPDPTQPRKDFWVKPIPESALKDLRDLASSIQKQGLINPILISVAFERKGDLYYKIIDGERRFRAVTEIKLGGLGRPEILAQVIEIQDPIATDLIRLTVQQTNKNWDPYDQAHAEKNLLDKLGGNISEVAEIIGISRQSIMNHQKIFQLKEESLSRLKDNGKELTYCREAAKLIDSLSEMDKAKWPNYEEILIDKILSGKVKTRDDLSNLITVFNTLNKGDMIKKQFFEDKEYTAKMGIEVSGVGSENTAKDAEIKAIRLIEMLSLETAKLRATDNTKLLNTLRTLRYHIDTFLS